ncbi:MAG TPA: beta-1,6-N-acetylglucosaminyltransferase [Oscillospiraceae bacterium]|nr:beta-1,6-N-acetylglucosaminyltransferase [Oscillospiraceae bacterium]HPF55310.1 beta-1,6-N-acetylglucosaminyltransferase [Clostridiales bacterium]HPK34713.1 beta-1,6-N-acetylglucosaminyltransferase [Oscillospiraceae bacterium]HPR74523.1 beta-1,6-N-acetylglucosaminyltransferase [Oscillospiraceae bacterium]
MKIAFLALAHNNPQIAIRLTDKLTKGTQNAVFFHIDKKTDITPFLAAENAVFISERQQIRWAGFSILRAEIELIRAALKAGDFNRFVVLQMPCYSALSNTGIEKFFSDPKKEYLSALNVTDSGQKRHLYKFRIYWHKDSRNPFFIMSDLLQGQLFSKFKFALYIRKPTITIDGKVCPLWCGWTHIALTRAAAEYVVAFFDTHPEVNAFFKTVFAPDESYIHTILFNSPFREQCLPVSHMNSNACTTMFFKYTNSVHVFERDEFETIKASGLPFFRKVDSHSIELLDLIDSQTGGE